jgi:hypothetical protein
LNIQDPYFLNQSFCTWPESQQLADIQLVDFLKLQLIIVQLEQLEQAIQSQAKAALEVKV